MEESTIIIYIHRLYIYRYTIKCVYIYIYIYIQLNVYIYTIKCVCVYTYRWIGALRTIYTMGVFLAANLRVSIARWPEALLPQRWDFCSPSNVKEFDLSKCYAFICENTCYTFLIPAIQEYRTKLRKTMAGWCQSSLSRPSLRKIQLLRISHFSTAVL